MGSGMLLLSDEVADNPKIDVSEVERDVTKKITALEAERSRRDLRRFVRSAWNIVEPKQFISNWHIDVICDHLSYVTFGDIRNLMVNIPPRMSKSLLASVLWPVWSWLLDPTGQFLFASYAFDLAIRDAVKSRRLIESHWFRERYSHVFFLDPSDNRKQRYLNNHGGHRISTSVGGVTTGEGGDVIVIDDAHNMKEVYSDTKRLGALSWWDNSMRSRLNNPRTGQKVLVGQRSHDQDLYGHVLTTEEERWVVLMMPMEYDPKRHCKTYFNKGKGPIKKDGMVFEDPRKERGELLNPVRFGPDEVEAERHAMSPRDYSAQYQQDPTSGGGLILKKKWWQQWCYPADYDGKDANGRSLAGRAMPMPKFIEIVSIYDTAFETEEENDFSARVSFGLFEYSKSGLEKDTTVHAMLLERWNERVEFPDLKTEAIGHHHEFKPDYTIIEKKASGASLVQELRRAGVPVRWVNPGTKDKVFRAHMVSGVLKDGRVWYVPRTWAYEVIDQCAKFPVGEFDDLVDCVVMGLAYIRRLNMVELPDDEEDEELRLFQEPKRRPIYG